MLFSCISLLIILSIPSAVFADVIEPGTKQVGLTYKISNIQNYPDYIFLAHGTPAPEYALLNSSEFSFYKLSTFSIYAIKKSDFNENELKSMDTSEIDNFFKNDPRVIKSKIMLEGSYGTVGMSNPLENATVILEITSLNGNNLEIKKSKVVYAYIDGSTQEESISEQNNLPEPSKNNMSFWIYPLFFILIPVLAIIAIVLIIIARKYK
ncbi:MAG: hypothetical protein HZC47_08295 [Methanobacterium sp.]|uniref:hypothetical protein n=1 Tax=Methanobacterium sp. TaxID=2164 RepID=UPI003D64CF4E|nr:hypothetical protein [Methanobacterium sp.]